MSAAIPPAPISINDTIVLNITGVSQIGPVPLVSYKKHVQEYAERLLNEMSLAELAHRANSSDVVQYTTTLVDDAEQVIRKRGVLRKQLPNWYLPARILQWILTVLVGVTVALIPDGNSWAIAFAVSAVLALVMTIVVEVYEYLERKK
jgi:hypothetical protein